MPKNNYVRIAIIIALVLLLYYLVIMLSRGVADGAVDSSSIDAPESVSLAIEGTRGSR